jgi:hypothetical protein
VAASLVAVPFRRGFAAHRQAVHANVLPDACPPLARSTKRSIALRENVIWLLPFVSRLRQPFGRTRVHALMVIVRIVAAVVFGLYADRRPPTADRRPAISGMKRGE